MTATVKSTASMGKTWIVSLLDDPPFTVRAGSSDRWIPGAGEHLLLLEPFESSDPSATLELAEGSGPATGPCGS